MKEINETGQGQIFKNKFLERLTKNNPPVAWVVYLFFAGILFVVGLREMEWIFKLEYFLFTISGFLFWTLYEYIHHRYLNHIDDFFPNSKLAKRLAFMMHGVHHEYPRDKDRMVYPPIFGIFGFSLYTGLFYLILGINVFFFIPGFITGYVLYSFIHLNVHKTDIPKWLKPLYKHHALHHYKYPNKAFGVSTTFWDRVFRTMPPTEKN